MSPEQLQALQNTVAESIEKHVNGKIRAIDVKLDTYIREDTEYKQRVEKDTEAWRLNADSKLEFVSNMQGFGKVSMYVGGLILTVGGAVALILKWFKN